MFLQTGVFLNDIFIYAIRGLFISIFIIMIRISILLITSERTQRAERVLSYLRENLSIQVLVIWLPHINGGV